MAGDVNCADAEENEDVPGDPALIQRAASRGGLADLPTALVLSKVALPSGSPILLALLEYPEPALWDIPHEAWSWEDWLPSTALSTASLGVGLSGALGFALGGPIGGVLCTAASASCYAAAGSAGGSGALASGTVATFLGGPLAGGATMAAVTAGSCMYSRYSSGSDDLSSLLAEPPATPGSPCVSSLIAEDGSPRTDRCREGALSPEASTASPGSPASPAAADEAAPAAFAEAAAGEPPQPLSQPSQPLRPQPPPGTPATNPRRTAMLRQVKAPVRCPRGVACCSEAELEPARRPRGGSCCGEVLSLFVPEHWPGRGADRRPVADIRPAHRAVSEGAVRRHAQLAEWSPTLLLYDTSPDPLSAPTAAGAGQRSEAPRRARHLPINGRGEELVENEHFVGRAVMMHRPPAQHMPCAHRAYFSKRKRRWEMRLQGRFRTKPVGKLYVGCVMEDFDYTVPLSLLASWLGSLSLAPLEQVLGARLHLTFGDRREAALQPDAELAHIVGELAVFDQIIVTAAGDEPPPICGELEGLGLSRSATSSSTSWAEVTREVAEGIDPASTYTFCFWSASRFMDLVGDRLVDLIPLVPALGLSSTVLGDWPAHFVFYSLAEGDDDGRGADGDDRVARHLERRKTYFTDLMIWSSQLPQNPDLLERYTFLDSTYPQPYMRWLPPVGQACRAAPRVTAPAVTRALSVP